MALFSGLSYWNDWTNGLYYLTGYDGEKLYSIQNFLNKVVTDIQYLNSSQVGSNSDILAKLPTVSVRMAIAFVAMIPIWCCFHFCRNTFPRVLRWELSKVKMLADDALHQGEDFL